MYDSVMVPCPKCGRESEFQTKSGPCLLRTYSLKNAPTDVLEDVNRHAPNFCPDCKTRFMVELTEQTFELRQRVSDEFLLEIIECDPKTWRAERIIEMARDLIEARSQIGGLIGQVGVRLVAKSVICQDD